jgi:hypothetical protein
VMIASGPSATSSAASLPNVWSNASSSAFVIALITVAIKNGVPNVRDRHLLGLFLEILSIDSRKVSGPTCAGQSP